MKKRKKTQTHTFRTHSAADFTETRCNTHCTHCISTLLTLELRNSSEMSVSLDIIYEFQFHKT